MNKALFFLYLMFISLHLYSAEKRVMEAGSINADILFTANPTGKILVNDEIDMISDVDHKHNHIDRYPYEEWLGFPVIVSGATMDGNLCVNLDEDLNLEMVYQTGTQLTCMDNDGAIMPGWPQTLDYQNMSCPSYGDVDGDGVQEIVVGTSFYGLYGSIYAFETDGTLLPGFPNSSGGTVRTPSLADLDYDGDMEIVYTYNNSGIGYLL